MDNYDKLETKFQQASKRQETTDFPAMDKVWTRLEDKLDAKVHKTKSKTWKKLAIAASVLLLVSLGYQAFKPNELGVERQNEVVSAPKDSVPVRSPQISNEPKINTENAVVTNEKSNPIIHENADAILKKQLHDQEPMGYHPSVNTPIISEAVVMQDTIRSERAAVELAKSRQKSSPFANRIFEAKSVQKEESDDKSVTAFAPDPNTGKPAQRKSAPLIVKDGQALKSEFKNIDPDEIESLILLPEPLYIINGVEYSEESLFSRNPTSPYAPLDKQEIEKIDVLQAAEAIKTYGKKGEKGVVIITTKNGKPASVKRK